MRVLAIIFGLLLLLPGLCFLGFGITFATNQYSWQIGIGELVVGGLITWGAVALLISGFK